MGDDNEYKPFERNIQLVAGLIIFGYRMWTDDQSGSNLLLDAPVNSAAFWLTAMQYTAAFILIYGVKAADVRSLLLAWRGDKG